jgi:hypothetical protein
MSASIAAKAQDWAVLEIEMRWKVCLGGALALVTGGLCLVAPQLGGLSLIVLALGAVAIVAYRLL